MPILRHTARFLTSFFAPCNYGSLSIGARFRHRILKKRWKYLINFNNYFRCFDRRPQFFPPMLLLSSLVTFGPLLLFSHKRASMGSNPGTFYGCTPIFHHFPTSVIQKFPECPPRFLYFLKGKFHYFENKSIQFSESVCIFLSRAFTGPTIGAILRHFL